MQLPPPSSNASSRVVIVGAGPAGMATALELAQKGVASTVLEKRGEVAQRAPLFAVIPPFADRLAALDADGALTKHLVPMAKMETDDLTTGRHGERTFDTPLAPDATRSRGDMAALLSAAGSPGKPGADTRRWSTVGIGDLENAMRGLAKAKYSDLIDLRYDTPVTSVRQGEGWAEALLAPAAGAAPGAGGAADAVRGAMLIDASGRNLLGSTRTVYPEQSHWAGAKFGPPPDGYTGTQRVSAADTPTGLVESAGDPQHLTLRLPSDDRRIVWTQVDTPAVGDDAAAARELVAARAKLVGIDEPLPDDAAVMPVTVQLSTTDNPADRRILAVGDSVRSPYFMTSTGAAAALVHDTPRAVDAVTAVLGGADPAAVSADYAAAVRQANEGLLALTRPRVLGDLGINRADAGPPTTVSAEPR
ncbi:MAG: binding domain [Thermoleophilia bacterium]|nr:binding domain [Thermoleophilia bacterium]